MPSPPRLRTQDYQFQVASATGYWRWSTRVDVSQASVAFSIRDIASPYGLLRDSIPIPGEVIEAMSASIVQLQQSFAPNILLSPASLTFTVDEGRGFTPAQPVQITNSGVFGSLLTAAITSSLPFMQVTPSSIGGCATNESGFFQVTVDSTSLLASGSPYTGQLTVQDSRAANNPQTVSVTVVVRPKAVISVSSRTVEFQVAAPLDGGEFPVIPTQQVVIQNTGPAASLLSFDLHKLTNLSPWLVSVTPVSGTLVGGASQPITLVVRPSIFMLPGEYREVLRVSGYSSNSQEDVSIVLTIT